jgi:exopolyphosphatase/guanosine-5'-triphosphate,3'-diphosphate pyrophosphatase
VPEPIEDPPSRPLAAIDIGTNSIHLLVARPTGNNRFEIIDREKEVVRLGSGSGDMKRLAPDAIDRGVEALSRFRLIADASGADVLAVATSAVREAENRDEFIRRARDEAGVNVEVVSGAEEARLIHLGVLQAVPVFDRRHLLIDIGGGSTEFVVGQGGEVEVARSLKLGAIRLTERFLRDEPLKGKAVAECRKYVRAYLTQIARLVHGAGFDVAVGSSGTILNLAEISRALRGEPSPKQVSGAVLTAKDLRKVVRALTAARTVEERTQVPGLDPKRADIILGGAIVLEQVVAQLGIDEVVTSDFALREGVLLDALRRRDRTSIGHLRDLRYESVLHLASIAPTEREHAERATELAMQLFEATHDLHGIDWANEELLEAAGLLANVGLFVSHDRHHLHSYYVIRNSDLLTGFTDHEIELIAQIARYHRKSAPKPSHPEHSRLAEADQHVVAVLAGILRVAFALDRTRNSVVKGLTVERRKRALAVVLDTAGEDAALELYTADARKGLLESALGVRLRFEVAQGAERDAAAYPAHG